MADADPLPHLNADECREPTLEDLVNLCRALNAAGARYLVVGGFAIRAAGYTRQTMDVDLLVETGVENETRVIQALLRSPIRPSAKLNPAKSVNTASCAWPMRFSWT